MPLLDAHEVGITAIVAGAEQQARVAREAGNRGNPREALKQLIALADKIGYIKAVRDYLDPTQRVAYGHTIYVLDADLERMQAAFQKFFR